jgi:uncharacterized protein YndB with AHSA1/START domain
MGKEMLHAVEIEADPAKVFEALSTADGLAGFWTPNVSAEPKVGSVATFGFAAAPVDLKMRVDELDAGRRVAWACLGDFPYWKDTSVTWDLAPKDGGTMVMFRHTGFADDYPDDQYAGVNYAWGRIVGRLKDYAETGKPDPFLS